MSVQQQLQAQNRFARRPELLSQLLLHPICPNPRAPGAVMDPEWSIHHVEKKRFRIGGMQWFLDLTGFTGEALEKFETEAVTAARLSGWVDMKGISPAVARKLERYWGAVSRPQYFDAIRGEPQTFVKAAQVLLTCEIALQKRIEALEMRATGRPNAANRPTSLNEVISGLQVYQHMAIVPVCWNVNDFNDAYLKARLAADPEFLVGLANETAQPNDGVFHQLAQGHTVTHALAAATKAYCDKVSPVGQVRCRAGQKILGSKAGSSIESIPA